MEIVPNKALSLSLSLPPPSAEGVPALSEYPCSQCKSNFVSPGILAFSAYLASAPESAVLPPLGAAWLQTCSKGNRIPVSIHYRSL